jgi:hypothetical protein
VVLEGTIPPAHFIVLPNASVLPAVASFTTIIVQEKESVDDVSTGGLVKVIVVFDERVTLNILGFPPVLRLILVVAVLAATACTCSLKWGRVLLPMTLAMILTQFFV